MHHLNILFFDFHELAVLSLIRHLIIICCSTGPLEQRLEEMDTLLNLFLTGNTPLTLLKDFNLLQDKLQSCLLPLLRHNLTLSCLLVLFSSALKWHIPQIQSY